MVIIITASNQFVAVSLFISGTPTYNSTHEGIPHLHALLHDAIEQVKKTGALELSVEDTFNLPLVMIGFSKGCIVLNQILHELVNYVPIEGPAEDRHNGLQSKKNTLENFVKKFKEMYWLDSGHSGDSGAWVTDGEVLKCLVHLSITIHIHVTPHQMSYPGRPWNRDEERAFVESLTKLGVKVLEKLHFDDEPRSFLNHFRVLNTF